MIDPRRSGAAWERARREHRRSVGALLTVVQQVDPTRWRRPVAEGKWTPAQIAEHLALVYEAVLREADGQPGMRALVGPLAQRLLRWVVLPHLLFHRSIPLRAPAPREARPAGDGPDQTEAVRRLRELADRVEDRLADAALSHLTHPYFGRLTPERALRFCAAHIDHHHRQIAAPAAR